MEIKNVWAVIPAYNEEKEISKIITKAKKYVSCVVVVDDGSLDNTPSEAEKAGALVLKHIINLGKGAALKTGCDYSIGNGAEYLIVLDADAQHDPEQIPEFIEKLKVNDVVFGCRKFTKNMPGMLRFGNRVISSLVKILYGVNIEDTQSGYRAFSSQAYRKIRWTASDYSMETEMIAKVGKHNLKYSKIEIKTIYIDKYKGTTVMDGLKIVANVIWMRLFNNI